MENRLCILILIILAICLIYIYVKFTISQNNKKSNKYKKYKNPKNNYFRNKPEHIDMKQDYIENLWEELKKN